MPPGILTHAWGEEGRSHEFIVYRQLVKTTCLIWACQLRPLVLLNISFVFLTPSLCVLFPPTEIYVHISSPVLTFQSSGGASFASPFLLL